LGEHFLKYVTPRGATPPQHTIIGDISGNYERISTKFSVISLLTMMQELSEKLFKYFTPFWGNPTPTFKYRRYLWQLRTDFSKHF